jgi:hypothetical protein
VSPGVPLNSTMRVRQAAHTRTPPTPCPPQMLSRRFSAGREAASARSVIDHVSWSPKKAPAHGRPPGRTFVPLDATGTDSYETLSAIAQTQLLGPRRPLLRRDGVPTSHPAAGDVPFRTPLRPPYAPDGVRTACTTHPTPPRRALAGDRRRAAGARVRGRWNRRSSITGSAKSPLSPSSPLGAARADSPRFT